MEYWFGSWQPAEPSTIDKNDGHETDPSTCSDSDSATSDPSPLRPQFLTGLARDFQRRSPYYLDDWSLSSQTPSLTTIVIILNASISSFFRQLIPALIFAGWMQEQTQQQLSAVEVLMGMGIVGVFYALFSGQPLVLVGVSGPVALLLGASYSLSTSFSTDFFTFFWWMCIWTSILHVFTACFGLVNLTRLITPFTLQVFEFFVAVSFIYKSIYDLIHPFLSADDEEHTMAYSSLVIGLLTFFICWKLHFAESWIYFTRNVRYFLASYNMLIAVLVATGLSYIPDFSKSVDNSKDIIQRIGFVSSTPYDWTPSVNRNWLESTPLSGIDTRGIFGALIPGFMLYILFFMEHSMSSAIVQAPKHKLKKPCANHWDFCVLGLSTIACGFLGLPPCCGVIPQASMHTRSLCTTKKDEHGNERISGCIEQRWSALLQASLMFGALALSSVLSKVPVGCLFGVLLYLGVDSLTSNDIWTRITLKFVMPSARALIAIVTNVSSWDTVQRYTGVQVGLSLVAFGTVYFTDYGYLFPLILAAGVPIRRIFLAWIFQQTDLEHLDSKEDSEEEIVEVEKHHVLSPRSDRSQRVHEFHHNDLVYDIEDVKQDAPEQRLPSVVSGSSSPRRQSHRRSSYSRQKSDIESGMQSPIQKNMVQSLSKVPARHTAMHTNDTTAPPSFLSSWHAWTHLFDTETTTAEGWCGTRTGVDDFSRSSERDELSIRKSKSSRSGKTEVYDADDATTVKSTKSSRLMTIDGNHTQEANKNRTMRIVTPSASELFDSDIVSLKSNRTRSDLVQERSKVRGLSGILRGDKAPISPKPQRSSSSWRSDRSIRKYSDVERMRSNEHLDFDVDRVVVPESILKTNKKNKSASKSAGRIAFAPNAQGAEDAKLVRQHSEQEAV